MLTPAGPGAGEDLKNIGDDETGGARLLRGVAPWVRGPACDEAASPRSWAAEASGGLLGNACELRREARLGVPEVELRCLRCDGEDMLLLS
jgi:hypothetical protein